MNRYWDSFLEIYGRKLHGVPLVSILEGFWIFCNEGERRSTKYFKDFGTTGESRVRLKRRVPYSPVKKVSMERKIPSLVDSCSTDIQSVFRFWNSLGRPLSIHRENSKVAKRAIDVIGKALLKYSCSEIQASIRQYYDLLTSSDTVIQSGTPGHLVGLDEFFGFTSYTLDRIKKYKVGLEIKSWFDECLPIKDPCAKYISLKHRIPDKFPSVTNAFRNEYVARILGGIKPRHLTAQDETCFRRASMRTVEFFERNKKKVTISAAERKYPARLVRYVFSALEHDVGELSKVSPGWLCSNAMFDKRLPAYLYVQAMIPDGRTLID